MTGWRRMSLRWLVSGVVLLGLAVTIGITAQSLWPHGAARTFPRHRVGSDRSGVATGASTQEALWGWGSDEDGQLGLGSHGDLRYRAPVAIPGLGALVAIAAGGAHTLALRRDGTVLSWGYNGDGALGNGEVGGYAPPHPAPSEVGYGLRDVRALAAGNSFSLALLADGTVSAWGYNAYGQLGSGERHDHTTPVQVRGLSGVIAIAAGYEHSLALTRAGQVYAWGAGDTGAVDDGATLDRGIPVVVAGLPRIVSVAAGEGYSLALAADGGVWAWGLNGQGELGDGVRDTRPHPRPRPVPGLPPIRTIAAGGGHVLALARDGTVWGWGDDHFGQVGDGGDGVRTRPVKVRGLPRGVAVTALAAGDRHSLALLADGTVWAWGDNLDGELGDGTTVQRNAPERIRSLRGVTAIAAGGPALSGSIGIDFSVALADAKNSRSISTKTRG